MSEQIPPVMAPHYNTWVSGINVLKRIGWIERVKKIEPVEMHNHMDSVTLWKSLLYQHKNERRWP